MSALDGGDALGPADRSRKWIQVGSIQCLGQAWVESSGRVLLFGIGRALVFMDHTISTDANGIGSLLPRTAKISVHFRITTSIRFVARLRSSKRLACSLDDRERLASSEIGILR